MKLSFLANLRALYGVSAPARLVTIYRRSAGPFTYLGAYWTTQNFAGYATDASKRYRVLRVLLAAGMAAQAIAAGIFFYAAAAYGTTGAAYFGAALLVSYPLVWAHVLFLLALVWALLHPKRYGKGLVCTVLEHQVKQLRIRNEFMLIAVAGSVGKTSTKLAVAELLSNSKRVCYQQGNYNDRLTVPLVFFGESEPGLYDLVAWAKIFWRNWQKVRQSYPYEVVVVELGTDGPGQMKDFAYLHPDLAVVTAIAEEHMEYFGTLEAVATEELTVFEYAKQVLVNQDDVAAHYVKGLSFETYGSASKGDYRAELQGAPTADGQELFLRLQGASLSVQSHFYGLQGAKIVLAAAAVGHKLGMSETDLRDGVASLRPFSGRMQMLQGVNDTILFDDTYNASPLAVKAALDVLGSTEAPQRIAILGSMNELGEVSSTAHREVGTYCDPKKLSLVVTIGKEAKEYLAPAAQARGCRVESFDHPREAGEFVRQQLQTRGAVLAKGSQNGVFAEESLKPLLADPEDTAKLVRQTPYWLRVKSSQFGD